MSRSYQVYATPFAFLIDETGMVRSKGIVNNRQQIEFVMTHGDGTTEGVHTEAEPAVEGAP